VFLKSIFNNIKKIILFVFWVVTIPIQTKQIGNAVPQPLAKALTKAVLDVRGIL